MIAWATDLVASGGLLGVFLLMVAENLFPPIPSEVIMPLAGHAAAQGRFSIVAVVLLGTLGAVLGNAFWFELARWFGVARSRALVARYGGRFGIGETEVGIAETTLRRHGGMAVFLGRFMPAVRTAISVPAGLIELPRAVFYGWTALGTLIWTGGLAVAGYALGDDFAAVERWAGPIGFSVLLAAAAVVGWLLLRAWRAHRAAG